MDLGRFDDYRVAALSHEDAQALRAMQPGDLGMSRGEWLFALGGEEAFVAAALAGQVEGRELRAGVWQGVHLVGVIGLKQDDRGSASISYALDARHRGQGIMTRACRILIDHGFRTHRLERIVIIADPGNQPSCAIAQRLGFAHMEVLKDLYRSVDGLHDGIKYVLTARAWAAWPKS